MGSGELGVPSLKRLGTEPGVSLVGVVTQPDRPQGRHRHLAPTPLGKAALDLGLPVLRPDNVNTPESLAWLRGLDLDLMVVASYGQILREPLLNLPRFGCLNLHASLLPKYRGAAPVQAAILAGDEETGVSFMKIDKGLDTGPVYEVVRMPLDGSETGAALEQALAALAAEHVGTCIRRICREGLEPQSQPAIGISLTRKLKKEFGRIDWHQSSSELLRHVRAYHSWPGSWFDLPTAHGPRRMLLTAAEAFQGEMPGETAPGEVVRADTHDWVVACGSGSGLRLVRMVPGGQREMSSAEFLRGCPVPVGTRLDGEQTTFEKAQQQLT
jgi:methionyl-tRNA formyltransferase